MTKTHTFFQKLQKLTLALAISSIFIGCTDEKILPISREGIHVKSDSTSVPSDSQKMKADCSECTYVVPADSTVIDGKVLGLKPGSVICLNGAFIYGSLEFNNIVGTEDNPIIIKNCGGTANIRATNKWHAVRTSHSKYFRITGGSASGRYGINIQGGEMGLKLDGLSTNFEVDHVEITKVGFAGIMAKTDPTCDDATIRGNFTMYDVSLNHNYVHATGGEGFYIGNSFYDGMDRACGKRLPHEIKGLKIFNNMVKNTGWEAIQVSCAIEGTEIYNNTIENYGTVNKEYQNNGLQIGSGTGGAVYNNLIKKGTGNGMIIMGIGDNIIYNNIIVDAGSNGVFCDERYTPGEGYQFINNTIVNPKKDGIRLYSELVPMNTVINNIIVNPGSYASYEGTRSKDDAFVYLASPDVNVNISNNLFVLSLEEIKFVNPLTDNYRLNPNSPAINFGKDISHLAIKYDFYEAKRKNGFAYDIGASEY
ncbi:MAG: right-handed parallel beta-helix repeat-containing protein [Cyclobacteriaceae bacterium]